jgi:hypothetical protein
MRNRWERPESCKNSAETGPASRVRAPTGGAIKKVGPQTRQERPAMDMRVRGKRPHGQKEVGGPTLKTCVSRVSGCRKSEDPRRPSKRCIPRAKARPAHKNSCVWHRGLDFGFGVHAAAVFRGFRRRTVRGGGAFDFATPRCNLRRFQPPVGCRTVIVGRRPV